MPGASARSGGGALGSPRVRWLHGTRRSFDWLVSSFDCRPGVRIIRRVVAAQPAPGGFVGRGAELARLEAALERAARDGSAVVVVGGEAGIGKTRLIGEFVAGVRQRGGAVLSGSCPPSGGRGTPYAPFVEALRALVHGREPATLPALLGPGRIELARLLPEIDTRPRADATAPPRDDGLEGDRYAQARLFEAYLGVLHRLGRDGPVVVVIDDIQWSDAGTRTLIEFLLPNARGSDELYVLAVRTDDLEEFEPALEFLAEIQRDSGVERLELGPLEPSETRDLLRELGRPRQARGGRTSCVGRRATPSSSSSWRRVRPRAGPHTIGWRPAFGKCSPPSWPKFHRGPGRSSVRRRPRGGASTIRFWRWSCRRPIPKSPMHCALRWRAASWSRRRMAAGMRSATHSFVKLPTRSSCTASAIASTARSRLSSNGAARLVVCRSRLPSSRTTGTPPTSGSGRSPRSWMQASRLSRSRHSRMPAARSSGPSTCGRQTWRRRDGCPQTSPRSCTEQPIVPCCRAITRVRSNSVGAASPWPMHGRIRFGSRRSRSGCAGTLGSRPVG